MNCNPNAFVNNILRGDKPSDIRSLIDPSSNSLVTEPQELKSLLQKHFANIFHCDVKEEEKVENEAPTWFRHLYQPKSSIRPEWYADLMQPFSDEETLSLVHSCGYFVAAGPDHVGAGIWRILVEQSAVVRHVMAFYLSACVRLSICPSSGKLSLIVPIPKKQHVENTLSNVRPISLQNAIVKLLMKGLAIRLVHIFQRHPILHPAQEAFVKGGAPWKCVDVCLDIWEISKECKRSCFCLFYDIEKAYDSVRKTSLLLALRRLRLPFSFVSLIADSLTDLFSCVRTRYGLTDTFPVLRSVRQGDPLAPLLYVIFMDAMHCGFEENPLFSNCHDGFDVDHSLKIASKGFADDTWIVSESLQGLYRLNVFANEWCVWNFLRLHPKKTKLAGRTILGDCMKNVIVWNDCDND